jgi:hypothetical protein
MALPARIKRTTSGGLSRRTFYEAKLRRRSRSLTRRCTLLLVVFLGALAVVYEFMWTYWLAGLNIPNVEHDAVTGQDRVRRRPDLSTKYDPSDHRAMHTYVARLLVIVRSIRQASTHAHLSLFHYSLSSTEILSMPLWRAFLLWWIFRFHPRA